MLFRVQWRDALRAVLFALACVYALPAILTGFTFPGNATAAAVVGIMLALTNLVVGSAICHICRAWFKSTSAETKLMGLWFGLITAATSGVLFLLAQGLGDAVMTVKGWDTAIAAGAMLTIIAALSAANEPRK